MPSLPSLRSPRRRLVPGRARPWLWAGLLGLCGVWPVAQAEGPAAACATDAQTFLRSHQWDPVTALWTLKPGVPLPAGVLPREAVLASREHYLSHHRWQDGRGWLAMRHAPRNLASVSPTQRRHDLQHFAQTHRWDEASGQWLHRRLGAPPQAALSPP